MVAQPAAVRKKELTNALKAGVDTGLVISKYEIDRNGRISIFTGTDATDTGEEFALKEVEKWHRK
ncbi:hypothetical protein [Pararhodospirillum oryzae]|uniref:Uncharacterized protein n=1 Tax=Pararhodospirillum oryzae TaxID=478448 RepID=A0A512H919_9PROT|nr:hypothetical protein [Pararhodospirillum oryzae]GEO81945.1 hypothetical protein ROR02_20760 [Pararhodospirillum oryzae]